jgi:UDP-N-acetyl-D-glucosamine dehydrogenase
MAILLSNDPLVCEFAAAGFRTVGVDIDPRRAKDLTDGLSPVVTVTNERLHNLQDALQFTTFYEEIHGCDVSVICVPTPFKSQYPDLSIVFEVVQCIKENLPENHLIVLESSVYPGATEEVIRPILETGEHRIGENLFLSPLKKPRRCSKFCQVVEP